MPHRPASLTAPSCRGRAASFAVAALALLAGGCDPGPRWTLQAGPLDPIVLSVGGVDREHLWAVGGTCDLAGDCRATSRALILRNDGRSDGASWHEVESPRQAVLWWVHALGPDDVWIVGEQGVILHWDGAALDEVPSGLAPEVKLFGVWGVSHDDLWAVGGVPDQSSTVLRWDGTAWAPVPDAPRVGDGRLGGTWYKVWGSAPDDVYLCGQLGTLAHWDGARFERIDLSGAGVGPRDGLFTVHGRARDEVYVVGGLPAQGKAIRFDGVSWAPVAGIELSRTQLLTGVHEDPGGDLAITGLGGARFLRAGPGGSFRDDSLSAPLADFHAAWIDAPDNVYAVGGNFYALQRGLVARYGR